ncbi:MAG: Mini-ribonuclease 3 [Christensenellaceae bacterium]|nr:Mini-ribonuclease 3 [Christensenellaceae bacterium]
MNYANTDNEIDLISIIRCAFPCEQAAKSPTSLGPLVLAYIGDTVYDLYVRTMLVDKTTLTAHGLHVRAAKLVCAKAQAEAFHRIEPLLTEEELAVFRRGRNAHMGTVPKNATIIDYRHATGLEAVLGWLYLSGRDERICELMRSALMCDSAPETVPE